MYIYIYIYIYTYAHASLVCFTYVYVCSFISMGPCHDILVHPPTFAACEFGSTSFTCSSRFVDLCGTVASIARYFQGSSRPTRPCSLIWRRTHQTSLEHPTSTRHVCVATFGSRAGACKESLTRPSGSKFYNLSAHLAGTSNPRDAPGMVQLLRPPSGPVCNGGPQLAEDSGYPKSTVESHAHPILVTARASEQAQHLRSGLVIAQDSLTAHAPQDAKD